MDVPSRRELPAALARSLSKALCTERTVVPPAENVLPAIGHAHRLMDSAAVSRRAVLAAEVSGGFEAERGRAAAYYADAIARIERRLAVATPDRAAVLRERLRVYRRGTGAAAGRDRGEVRGPARHQAVPAACATGARTAARGRRAARVAAVPDEFRLAIAGPGCTRRCAARRVRPRPRWCRQGEARLRGVPVAEPPTAAAAKPAAGTPAPAAGKPAPVKSPAPARPAVAKPPAALPAAAPKPGQRRAVPPKVRGPQQKARPALAERVWSAVASGDRAHAGQSRAS